ncbi:MAG: T9SS C-terminal target domain-containing protein, partial [Bacteroidetes bacterium]
DAVGGSGADPGTGWAVAGTANATVDKVLSRKSSIQQGNTNWTASRGTSAATSEWVLSPGTYSSSAPATLGSHSSSCTGLPACVSPQPAISATLTPTPTVSGIIAILIGLMVPVDFGGQSHLLVLSSSPQLSAAPANGSLYAPGSTLGNGLVIGSISSSNGTLYSSSLLPGATYYAFIFSYNHSACSGGPAYSLTSANTTISLPVSAAPSFGGSAQAAVESDADLFPGIQSWFASVLPGSVLRLHAEVSEAGELKYEILDLSGRTLRQELRQVSAGVWEEDLSLSLPAGLYLIRLSSRGQSHVLKVRL